MVPPGSLSYFGLVVEACHRLCCAGKGDGPVISERVILPALIRDVLRLLEVSRNLVMCVALKDKSEAGTLV